MKPNILHIWVPELIVREGGIQSYSIEMVEAALEILGPGRITLLSKSDDVDALKKRYEGRVRVHATGHIPLPMRSAAFGSLLIRTALAEEPDLIVCTHANFAPVAVWLFRRLRIPAAISAHGIEVWGLPPGPRRRALQAVDTILPVSDFTKNRLRNELHIDDDHFQVIPDTFDSSRFSPGPTPIALRQRYGLHPQDKVLLTVSRLITSESYKGYQQTLSVLPSLLKKIPRLKYLIVGRGDDMPNIQTFIRENDIEKNVILAGYVSDAELPDHYRLADAFAMPSKREGFGIVYLEAMGCGKPCLGGNKDAAIDALRNGELGILVDPDDLAELEAGLFRLLTQPPPDPAALAASAERYFGRQSFRAKVRQMLENFGLRRC